MRLQDFLSQEFVSRVSEGASVGFTPVIGQNVFIGYMPSQVAHGLLFAATIPLNQNHYTNLFTGGAQVIYRSDAPDKSAKVMRQVAVILQGFNVGTLAADGIRVLKILPRHEPIMYRREDNGTFEASVNFDVICSFQ